MNPNLAFFKKCFGGINDLNLNPSQPVPAFLHVPLNKQLAKVTTELQAVTRRAARVDKELGLEHDLRKDLERKLVLAKETRRATEPEPNRTCSFLWA